MSPVVSAAVTAGVVSALWIYNLRRLGLKDTTTAWKVAPHASFFAVTIAPFAAFYSSYSLSRLSALASDNPDALPPWLPLNLVANFEWIVGVAALLAILACTAFFVSTSWSPDKLRTQLARLVLRDFAARWKLGPKPSPEVISGMPPMLEGLSHDAIAGRLAVASSRTRDEILLSPESQRAMRLLDRPAQLLTGLQAFAILTVGFMILASAALLFLISPSSESSAESVSVARVSSTFSVALLLPYPLLFATYRSQVRELDPRWAGSGSQEAVSATFLMLCAGLLILSGLDQVSTNSLEIVAGVTTLLGGILSLLLPHVTGTRFVRLLVGSGSSLASQVSILVAVVLVGALGLTVLFP